MSLKLSQARAQLRAASEAGLVIAESKSMSYAEQLKALGPIELECKKWSAEVRSLEYVEAKRAGYGGMLDMGAARGAANYTGLGTKRLGAAPNAMPDAEQMLQIFEAVKSQQPLKIVLKDAASDASNATNLLQPAQLLPGIVALRREPARILDHIPSLSMNGAAVEWITHASSTGTAGMVAAGGLKPETVLNTTKTILLAKKVAVYASQNDETLADLNGLTAYVAQELLHQLYAAENFQLLLGDGTGENLTGLLNWSGILTRVYASGGETQGLDTVDMAIGDLRAGPAFTEPDAIIIHPLTWGRLRRTKSSQGTYLVNPDPTAGEANSLWGCPILATTSCPEGTAVVANLAAAATGLIREGLTFQTSKANNDAFQRNQTGFIYEERIQLGVQVPAAICKVTGL
jgi:HK97 family phage major capsid protein